MLEELVKAHVGGDTNSLIKLIEEELSIAKEKGRANVARRLRNILTKMPKKVSYHGQSLGSFPLTLGKGNMDNPLFDQIDSNISLEEVILENRSEKIVQDFLAEWKRKNKLIEHGIFPINKLLFYGPPGTGKTKLVHAIATALGIPLITVRLDELFSSYLGKTGKNIREILEYAKRDDVIIFLDEIDTIAKQRDDLSDLGELKRVVTVLLQNIDSFPNNSILIGATNHENLLDKAIWRRFSLKVEFELPSEKSRKEIFKLYLGDFAEGIDVNSLARLSEDLSGSAIYDVCRDIKKGIVLGEFQENKKDIYKILIRAITFHFSKTRVMDKSKRAMVYDMCQKLKDEGLSLREIEELTGMPYTTLRDNVK